MRPLGTPIDFPDKGNITVTLTQDSQEASATLFQTKWGKLAVVWHGQHPQEISCTFIPIDSQERVRQTIDVTTPVVTPFSEDPMDIAYVLHSVAGLSSEEPAHIVEEVEKSVEPSVPEAKPKLRRPRKLTPSPPRKKKAS